MPLFEQISSSPRPSRMKRLAKEALVIFKELRSARARRVWGCCRRFHWRAAQVFIWRSLFFPGKRSDSKQTSMQSTHMQAHTDSNKANNETSTDRHADRCMQTLTECTAAAVRDRDRRSSIWSCRDRRDLLDARPVASLDHDDRPRMFHWPHTQTLDYHCRHSMAIPGDAATPLSLDFCSGGRPASYPGSGLPPLPPAECGHARQEPCGRCDAAFLPCHHRPRLCYPPVCQPDNGSRACKRPPFVFP